MMLWCNTMSNGDFGGLIRRPKRPEKKIIIPPKRAPLKIKTQEYKPTRLPSPSSSFERRKEELRRKVVARDPSLRRPPKGPPERTPLKITAKPKPPERTPLKIDVRPKSHFEWVRAA